MDPTGTSSFGIANEVLRTCTHSPVDLSIQMQSALKPPSSGYHSPDTRVFITPEQGSHLTGRDEVFVQLHPGNTREEPEHAFQNRMHHYTLDELTAEWDVLFQGDASDDLRNNTDVYRALRRDLRSMAFALKHSFRLVIDSHRWPPGGTGPSSSGGQHLQPCISELKGLAQEMANTAHLTRENNKLRMELGLMKQSNHLLQAQVHEAQVSLLRMEEEVNSAMSEATAAQLACANETQRAASCEAVETSLRNQNNLLQRQLVQAGDEIRELEKTVRALETKLAAAEEVQGLAAQLETKEDLVTGNNTHARDVWGSLEVVTTSVREGSSEEMRWAATSLASGGSKEPHSISSISSQRGAAAAAGTPGRGLVESSSVDVTNLANDLVRGSQLETRLQEMPPEVRRDMQQWLAQLIRKIKEDNVQYIASQLAKLRETPAGAGLIASAAAGVLSRLDQRLSSPGRESSDSWHTEDETWGTTRPAVRAADGHTNTSVLGPQSFSEALQQKQHLPRTYSCSASEKDVAGELEVARENISHLKTKLTETQAAYDELQQRARQAEEARALLEASRTEAQAALEEALRQTTQAAEAAEGAEVRAETQAALAAQAQTQVGEAWEALQQAVEARDSLKVELREATAAVEGHIRVTAELVEARERIASLESQLAISHATLQDLEGRLKSAEQREAEELQSRDAAKKELVVARQRIVRLQSDLLESRADGKIARGEAIAATRDAKAANSGLVKTQREMEAIVQRLRKVEAERDGLVAALAAAQAAVQAVPEPCAAVVQTVVASSGGGQQQFLGGEIDSPEPSSAPVVKALDAKMLALELEEVQRELETTKARLAEEQRTSKEEASRLAALVKALEADLAAVRAELAHAEATSRERVVAVEAQLAKGRAEVEAAHEQNAVEIAQLRSSLVKEQKRVEELEGMRRAVEQDMATAAASTSADAQERLRQLEGQLQAAEEALRQAEQGYGKEVEMLHMQLSEAEQATAAAVATAAEAAAKLPNKDVCRERLGEDDAVAAQRFVVDGVRLEEQQLDDDNEDDVVVLRARCRALRGKLQVVQSKFVSVVEAWEAAAQGRLEEKLAEARVAAATGHVKTEEEFWMHNKEVHSLHALVSSLHATSLYAGSSGAAAIYGDNRADGAGGVVASGASQLAASYRRRQCHQYMEMLDQIHELLSGAAEAIVQRPTSQLPQLQPSSSGTRLQAVAAGSSDDGHHSHGRFTGQALSCNHEAAAVAGPGHGANGHHSAALKERGVAGADPSSPLQSGLPTFQPISTERGIGATITKPTYAAVTEASKGTGRGQNTHTMAPPPPPMPSSSFTSDTGSSLADDDLTSIGLLYEIPPMGSPPKYDLSEWNWK